MTVLTDGRKEYISQALPTWIEAYGDSIEHKAIIDDSGNAEYRHWLSENFPDFIVVAVGKDRCGYPDGMRKVFETVSNFDQQFNLHVEDDFVLHSPPKLENIIDVIKQFPELSQMSLMRQPWYPNEIQHGGVIEALEANGSYFSQRITNNNPWVIHRAFWTCNPNIFPRWVANRRWPDAPWSEMFFSKQLRNDEKVSGIWGDRKTNWACVEHIGVKRNGTEY